MKGFLILIVLLGLFISSMYWLAAEGNKYEVKCIDWQVLTEVTPVGTHGNIQYYVVGDKGAAMEYGGYNPIPVKGMNWCFTTQRTKKENSK